MNNFNVLDYKIEINKVCVDDGGGYIASMPEIGAIADGETIEEAISELEEVANEYIKLAREDNKKIPIPKMHKIQPDYSGKLSIRIPKFLHKAVAKQAEEESCSINQLITSYISVGVGNEFGKKHAIELDSSYEVIQKAIFQHWGKILHSTTYHNIYDIDLNENIPDFQ